MKQEETTESTCEGEGNPTMRQPRQLIDGKFLVTETEIILRDWDSRLDGWRVVKPSLPG
jgi:hypothetical protein